MINDLIDITQLSVFESMMDYMNKIETIIEYAGINDVSDKMVMELFDIYLEATDRRKKADEIDDYMKKHNWGNVDANSSAKATKARQARNFLMLHDFDPKNGTIKSVDGKRRIPFNLNAKSSSNYILHKYNGIPVHDNIEIGSKRGVDKNIKNINFTTNHEKAHENFAHTGKAEKWNKEEDKNERGIKFIDDYKKKGKNISGHDDGTYLTGMKHQSPEEIEADLHAAKNTRVRTKYAGSKRAVKRSGATRNLNDKEIDKFYLSLHKLGPALDEVHNKLPKNVNSEEIKNVNLLKNSFSDLDKFLKSIKCETKVIDGKKVYSAKYDPKFSHVIRLRDMDFKGFANDNTQFEYNNYIRSLLFCKTVLRTLSSEAYQDPDKQKLIDIYNNEVEKSLNAINKILKEYPDMDNYLNTVFHAYTMSFQEVLKYFSTFNSEPVIFKDADKYNKFIASVSSSIFHIGKADKYSKSLDEYLKLLTFTKGLDKKTNQFRKEIQKFNTEYGKRANSDNIKDSTQMRKDFVKKYMNEYFIEFMLDYFSYENCFLCD